MSNQISHPYCNFARNKDQDNPHRIYHDTEYGFPAKDDNALFSRLILEINQAGLSWNTILLKKDNFFKAYNNFDLLTVSKYTAIDVIRLMNDKGIIRNKLKINAAIYNAKQILKINETFGSFKNWLEQNRGLTKENWILLFKENFKFTGAEITNEFLMSTGYLKGAHDANCPIHKRIEKLH
ncbi:MAG: DNA-3-methyladenine glycosylase I [Lishizhenia sp.]